MKKLTFLFISLASPFLALAYDENCVRARETRLAVSSYMRWALLIAPVILIPLVLIKVKKNWKLKIFLIGIIIFCTLLFLSINQGSFYFMPCEGEQF